METETILGRGSGNISTKLLVSNNDRSEAEMPKPHTRPDTYMVRATSAFVGAEALGWIKNGYIRSSSGLP